MIFAVVASAAAIAFPNGHTTQFLPHGSHMSVRAKVSYFQRSVRKDETAIAFLTSGHAPRTLERHSVLRWYKDALVWHTHLLHQYAAKLPPIIDSCTATILGREGGMNPHAYNPRSGAYGGPQALPGEKMAAAGADWRDNIWTQIRWMIGYETTRYGSPCAALAAWDRQGWY